MGCEGSSPPSVDPGVGMVWKHIQAQLSETVGRELFGCQVFFPKSRGKDGNETCQELQRKRRHTHRHTYGHAWKWWMSELDMWLSQSLQYISFLARSMGTGFGNLYTVEGLELSAFHMTAMLVSATEKLVGLQERNHGVTRLQSWRSQ